VATVLAAIAVIIIIPTMPVPAALLTIATVIAARIPVVATATIRPPVIAPPVAAAPFEPTMVTAVAVAETRIFRHATGQRHRRKAESGQHNTGF
jgi:hypothetical protein